MKKLILKSLLFLSIIVGVHLLLISHTYYLLKKQTIKIDTKNIIIGDSNPRNAINNKIFKQFQNFAQGGESYLFAYTKLKIITEENKIDTLILSFAPHNIINNNWTENEKWIKGNGALKSRMCNFFPYYSKESHLELLLKGNPQHYITSWNNIGKTWISNVRNNSKKRDLQFLGGYLKNTKIQNKKNFIRYEYEKPSITKLEIKYLNKIIEICKNKNIKLIFLATPKNHPRTDFKYYDKPEFHQYYKKHYKDIDFLNFQYLNMPKDSYADISHLSYIGSDYFSSFLVKNKIKDLLQNPKFNEKLTP